MARCRRQSLFYAGNTLQLLTLGWVWVDWLFRPPSSLLSRARSQHDLDRFMWYWHATWMERDSSTSWSPTSFHITDGQDLIISGVSYHFCLGGGGRGVVVDEMRVKQAINLKRGVRVRPIICFLMFPWSCPLPLPFFLSYFSRWYQGGALGIYLKLP